MSREAKMDHKIQLDTARYAEDGLTGTWHASPARRGEKMTPAEYMVNYMGRKPSRGMAAVAAARSGRPDRAGPAGPAPARCIVRALSRPSRNCPLRTC